MTAEELINILKKYKEYKWVPVSHGDKLNGYSCRIIPEEKDKIYSINVMKLEITNIKNYSIEYSDDLYNGGAFFANEANLSMYDPASVLMFKFADQIFSFFEEQPQEESIPEIEKYKCAWWVIAEAL